MSIANLDPLPVDIRKSLERLSAECGVAPSQVLREALDLYAREREDQLATERAERLTPRSAELEAIAATNPKPAIWHDSEEALF